MHGFPYKTFTWSHVSHRRFSDLENFIRNSSLKERYWNKFFSQRFSLPCPYPYSFISHMGLEIESVNGSSFAETCSKPSEENK